MFMKPTKPLLTRAMVERRSSLRSLEGEENHRDLIGEKNLDTTVIRGVRRDGGGASCGERETVERETRRLVCVCVL